MKKLRLLVALAMLLERFWRLWMVQRFFRRPIPVMQTEPQLVSILQPVLSGDPTMAECLERSLRLRSHYRLEFIWIADEHDEPGQQICRELIARYPERAVHLLTAAPAPERENPKVAKLIVGMGHAHGDVICVLDDDTMLPDDGLEECLPFLDQPGVGLAFGLPYYVNFSDAYYLHYKLYSISRHRKAFA